MASQGTKAGRGPKKSHSVRVHDDIWAKARRRAQTEGTTINGVVEEIIEGYAAGLVNLPRITKTYTQQAG